ncbi:MAG: tripartite tricarboxylate transporter substrate binding protein [Burkholderiales bacterium]|nr:tripartite tricarboxylate transporter substrate binding protein [Burkholderiales bacterium]
MTDPSKHGAMHDLGASARGTPSSSPRRHLLLAGAGLLAVRPALHAATWPERAVTIFVPSAPGGAADFTARSFAAFASRVVTGSSFLADNRAGAGGILGTVAAKNAAPDGHAFLLSTNSTHAANLSLYAKPGYDPQKDFEPVGLFGRFGTVLMVRANSPHDTLPKLLEAAKRAPGKLSFGYYSSSSQVPAELLKARAQIDAVGVSYKNITQIITDLIGGQLDFAFLDMLSASPALQNNSLRAIGVSSPSREPTLPNVPPVSDVLPGYAVQGWIGLHAPAGTPRHAIDRMAQLTQQAVADEGFKKSLESRGMMVEGMTPERLKAFVAEDIKRWAEWVKVAGIQPQ